LTSLEGSPDRVGGHYYIYNNRLTSLKGFPNYVGGQCDCFGNEITNLEGYTTVVENFHCSHNPIYSIVKPFTNGVFFSRGRDKNELIELFNDTDMIRGTSVIFDRLKWFYEEIGKEDLSRVRLLAIKHDYKIIE